MLGAARPGPNSFTEERVRKILTSGLETHRLPELEHEELTGFPLHPPSNVFHRRAESIAPVFRTSALDAQNHISRLDRAFSSFLGPLFKKTPDSLDEDALKLTIGLLERLPEYPVPSDDEHDIAQSVAVLPVEYRVQCSYKGACCTGPPELSWRHLSVVQFISSTVIRYAYSIATSRQAEVVPTQRIYDMLDYVAMAYQSCATASQARNEALTSHGWFVAKAFLWCTWQRMTMLFLWLVFAVYLRKGIRWEYLAIMVAQRTALTTGPAFEPSGASQTESMCNWALRLLQSDRSCLLQDFRRFHEVYHRTFGKESPRCCMTARKGVFTTCSGQAAAQCNRFTGMKPEDQSAHAPPCQGNCRALKWDEASYRSVRGGRAVQLTYPKNGLLQYCEVSSRTMAISHVWSHGQGGRPEDGMNSCLHRRYISIAQSKGCDSYWMDTPCIPQDHNLRRESIANINSTFANSLLTLITDRDLMTLNVDILDAEVAETLVMTLLVSDWNVRAWTLLEGYRGRADLHLLCRGDKIVSLKECLLLLRDEARLDSTILALAIQQLFPEEGRSPTQQRKHIDDPHTGPNDICKYTGGRKSKCDERGDKCSEKATEYNTNENHHDPDVMVEEAACLLHHRHASRPGDEIVIWSLLCSEQRVSYSATDFWSKQICDNQRYCSRHGFIFTGFLVSSTPRLNGIRGLSWAPARPDVQTAAATKALRLYYPYDGFGSVRGRITSKGLKAEWLTLYLQRPDGISHLKKEIRASRTGRLYKSSRPGQVWGAIEDEFKRKTFKGRDQMLKTVPTRCRWVALLFPAEESNMFAHPSEWGQRRRKDYRGPADGPVAALVASNDGQEWTWIRVQELPADQNLPPMGIEKILLV